MLRLYIPIFLAFSLLPTHAAEAELRQAFVGRPVTVKIDMPGTHEGVNLHLDRDDPIDRTEYSQYLKEFGVAIPKGRQATVTAINVKKNNIEFQLDGGGFGTYGDDTAMTVTTTSGRKSIRERRLESEISSTGDPARRRRLESTLRSERSRRRREEERQRERAKVAAPAQAQKVLDNRRRGGSRFNLRWNGDRKESDLTPQILRTHLAAYVVFEAEPLQPSPKPNSASTQVPAIRKDMKLQEVEQLFGPGRLVAETEGDNQLTTQDWEFSNAQYNLSVTAAAGVVVRYRLFPRPQ